MQDSEFDNNSMDDLTKEEAGVYNKNALAFSIRVDKMLQAGQKPKCEFTGCSCNGKELSIGAFYIYQSPAPEFNFYIICGEALKKLQKPPDDYRHTLLLPPDRLN